MRLLHLLLFAVGWVILAVTITYLRFGNLPGGFYEVAAAVLGFFLLGLLTGWVFLRSMSSAANGRARTLIVAGYVLSIPFAYFFGIVGPLTLEIIPVLEIPKPISYLVLFPIAIAFWGSIPSVVFMAVGSVIGNLVKRS